MPFWEMTQFPFIIRAGSNQKTIEGYENSPKTINVFNHNHKSYEKKMVEHLGTGFDVIIEHLANINLGHDLQMLKEGARVMVVGCRGSVNINPRHLMMPEASIRSVG